MDLSGMGRILLLLAVVIAVVGVLLILAGRGVLPRLPGDIAVERGNSRLYFPLGTSILLSVVLTIALNLFLRRYLRPGGPGAGSARSGTGCRPPP
jgi:Protein of unknown function (DUF2905)